MISANSSQPVQNELWTARAKQRDAFLVSFCMPMWEIALDAAQVRAGRRFLDAGCGSGGASLLAMQRGVKVHGIDAAEGMIALARERVSSGDFRVCDIQSIPCFEDASFDCIIAINSVHFAADPSLALRELRRLCAPGGRAVVITLGTPEEFGFSEFFAAARKLAPPGAPEPFAPGAEITRHGVLERMVEQAGLRVVYGARVDCPFRAPNFESCWLAWTSIGPVRQLLEYIAEDDLKRAVQAAATQFTDSGGRIEVPNAFHLVTATVG